MHIILTPTSAAYYLPPIFSFFFFFFNDPPTTEIYTLSLHDALPTSGISGSDDILRTDHPAGGGAPDGRDRKSTRLNSSHPSISYAVFCLKKKKQTTSPATAPKRDELYDLLSPLD